MIRAVRWAFPKKNKIMSGLRKEFRLKEGMNFFNSHLHGNTLSHFSCAAPWCAMLIAAILVHPIKSSAADTMQHEELIRAVADELAQPINSSAVDIVLPGDWVGVGKGNFGMTYKFLLKLETDNTFTLEYHDQAPPHTFNPEHKQEDIIVTGSWKRVESKLILDACIKKWTVTMASPGLPSISFEITPSDEDSREMLTNLVRKDVPTSERGFREPPSFTILQDGSLTRPLFSFQGRFTRSKTPIATQAIAVKLRKTSAPKAAVTNTEADPVGEWTTKDREPGFSVCFWESGEARGEFDSTDQTIILEGRWRIIEEGQWQGHVEFEGFIDYWGIQQESVTPRSQRFTYTFGFQPQKLTLVRYGDIIATNGVRFSPSGRDGDDLPILARQNDRRPIRQTEGNK